VIYYRHVPPLQVSTSLMARYFRQSLSTIQEDDETEDKRRMFIQFQGLEGSDELAEIVLVESGVNKPAPRIPWVFRVNKVLATWLGMQIGI
jgi:hypothetical protein